MAFRTTNPQGAQGFLNIGQQQSAQAMSQREAELMRLYSAQQGIAQRILAERQQREALKGKDQKKGFGGAIGGALGGGLGAAVGLGLAPFTGGATLLPGLTSALGVGGSTALLGGLGANIGGSIGGAFDPIGTPNVGAQVGGQLTNLSSFLAQQQIQQNFVESLREMIKENRDTGLSLLGGSGMLSPTVGPPLPPGI